LDAMAASRPVVCTDEPVMRENVVDGGTGILVPPGDPRAMRAAILSLLRDPEIGDAMGRAARARYEERHTLPAFAQRVRGILADLTQARQS
jgi:glycosyltransferase involved in cell wall biosynthesis